MYRCWSRILQAFEKEEIGRGTTTGERPPHKDVSPGHAGFIIICGGLCSLFLRCASLIMNGCVKAKGLPRKEIMAQYVVICRVKALFPPSHQGRRQGATHTGRLRRDSGVSAMRSVTHVPM